jgi:hypothetical protein
MASRPSPAAGRGASGGAAGGGAGGSKDKAAREAAAQAARAAAIDYLKKTGEGGVAVPAARLPAVVIDNTLSLDVVKRVAAKMLQGTPAGAGAGDAGGGWSSAEGATPASSTPSAAPTPPGATAPPATAAGDDGLPAGWTSAVDGKGRTFYIHAATGVKQWGRPGGDGGATSGGTPAVPAAVAGDLPDGWKAAVSGSGRTFYYRADGTKQWHHPGAPASAATSAPAQSVAGWTPGEGIAFKLPMGVAADSLKRPRPEALGFSTDAPSGADAAGTAPPAAAKRSRWDTATSAAAPGAAAT